jgi:hypothetical protein
MCRIVAEYPRSEFKPFARMCAHVRVEVLRLLRFAVADA